MAKFSLVWLAINPNIVRHQVEKSLGQPLSFTELEPDWQGFSPEIRLHNVHLLDQEGVESLLHLRELRVGFDLRRWIASGYANALFITIKGAHIEIHRWEDGSVSLAGLASNNRQSNNQQAWPWLLRQGELNLLASEVRWVDHYHNQPPKRLKNVDIRLANQGNTHIFQVALENSEQQGERVQLFAELEGDPFGTNWHAAVYLKGERIQLAPWLRAILANHPVTGGEVNVELWSDWREAYPHKVQGRISLQNIGLEVTPTKTATLSSLSTNLFWQGNRQNWQLDLRQLRLVEAGIAWTPGRLVIQHNQPNGSIAGYFPHLKLGTLQNLLPLFQERSEAKYWRKMRPDGVLRDLRFQIQTFATSPPQFRYSGYLEALSLQAWQKIPGFNGISCVFSGNQQQGTLFLDTQDAKVHAPMLFHQPLAIEQLTGRIDWQNKQGQWTFRSQELQLANPVVATLSRFLLRFPNGASGPFLDLQTHLSKLRTKDFLLLLPTKKMPAKLSAWFQRSLLSGQVSESNLLVRGQWNDFPFEQEEGRFQMLANVEDLRLRYHPDWPQLQGLHGQIEVQKRRVDMSISAGELFAAQVKNTHVILPRLGKHVIMEIDGTVEGQLVSGLRFLNESPLQKRFGPMLKHINVSGKMRLDLKLKVPLYQGAKVKVKGKVILQNAGLQVRGLDQPFHAIRGNLFFTSQGIQTKKLDARLDGVPLKITVAPSFKQILITGKGQLTSNQLRRWNSAPILHQLYGESKWRVTLSIPQHLRAQPEPVRLQLESDLQGLAIRLPAPLGKKKEIRRRLRIDVMLSENTKRPIHIAYGDNVSMALLVHKENNIWHSERGELRLGSGSAVLPTVAGIRVVGHYPALALSEWQAAFSQNTSPNIRLKKLDLYLNQLEVLGQELSEVHLVMESSAEQLIGHIKSDQIEGHIRVPWGNSTLPLTMHMKRLQLDRLIERKKTKKKRLHPMAWPLLDISAKQFVYDGLHLGNLYLKTTHQEGRLVLQALDLHDKEIKIRSTGHFDPTKNQTQIVLDVNSASFGNTLKRVGFTSVEGGQADFQFSLDWPGDPTDFSLTKLGGLAEVRIAKGRLLDVEPGVGRALGLLNVSLVRSRLKGDFSDLFEQGFPFENLHGKFRFQQGNIYTNKLSIQGPSANIELVGRSSLVKKDYDQTITVTPKLGVSLPLAIGVGVSPAAGAAIFVAQKVLGDQMNRITRYKYKVEGHWDAPIVTRIQPKILSDLEELVNTEEDFNVFDEEEGYE